MFREDRVLVGNTRGNGNQTLKQRWNWPDRKGKKVNDGLGNDINKDTGSSAIRLVFET